MKKSKFKNQTAKIFVEQWIDSIIQKSALSYEKFDAITSFGKTRILSVNHAQKELKPIVYVPGARTCGIFLDLSNQLQILANKHRIYLLDVVGQVGMSDVNCPSLKDSSYGKWLDDICQQTGVDNGIFVGASFGGQIILNSPESRRNALKKRC